MASGSALAGFLLLLGAMSAPPTSVQPASVAGAYERMSPGNQRIARALFEAQAPAFLPAATAGARPRAPRILTLDQIAAQKESGQGWGQVFQTMRADGLLRETNLAQVMRRYDHRRHASVVAVSASGTAASLAREAVQSPR
jgi:hypothetical protein